MSFASSLLCTFSSFTLCSTRSMPLERDKKKKKGGWVGGFVRSDMFALVLCRQCVKC